MLRGISRHSLVRIQAGNVRSGIAPQREAEMSNRLSGPRRLFLRVAVFAICGLDLGGAPLPGGSPTWRVAGGQAAGNLGASVASAGDVNGDGIDDIIVGEPGYDSPTTPNPHEGRALVYLGSPLGPSTTPAWMADGAVGGFGSA